MATFEQLYRDINQQYDLDTLNRRGLYFTDLLNIVNDEYSRLRQEWVAMGRGQYFAVHDDVFAAIPDFSYPEFYVADLTYDVLASVPTQKAVYASVVWHTSDELKNEVASHAIGSKVSYNGKVYKAVTQIADTNTYGLVYSGHFKNYTVGNQLKYFVGDTLLEHGTNRYWKVTTEFTATSDIVLADVSYRVYWKELFSNYDTANYYDFNELTRNRLYKVIDKDYAFSIYQNKVYTPKQNGRFTISYVPEWVDVTDLATEVILPSSMVTQLRTNILTRLAKKIELQNVAGS